MKTKVCRLIVWAFILTAFAGCGKDTKEAKTEDAKTAIDSRDFSKAVSILEPLLDKNGDGVFNKSDQDLLTADDAEAAQLLASARFGKAGIDLVKMLDLATKAGTTAAVIHRINDGFLPAAFAASCINDSNFKIISDMVPPHLVQQNLNDLQSGLDIIEKLMTILKNSGDHLNQLKQEHLLKAVGGFAQIVVAIIVATDSNGDNIPDHFSQGSSPPGVTSALVTTVIDSFAMTVAGLSDAGLLDSDLLRAVNKLKTAITTDPNLDITVTNLSAYLQRIVTSCSFQKKPQ